jgi:hypothetical protein
LIYAALFHSGLELLEAVDVVLGSLALGEGDGLVEQEESRVHFAGALEELRLGFLVPAALRVGGDRQVRYPSLES